MLPRAVFFSTALPRSLSRFLRRFVNFLYYDGVELLVILLGVAVILLIWEFTFWR